jgi:hypothetical protein
VLSCCWTYSCFGDARNLENKELRSSILLKKAVSVPLRLGLLGQLATSRGIPHSSDDCSVTETGER